MQLGFILSLLFAILITVFAIQNSEVVDINFLFTNVPVSQALVIFISAAIGAIIVTILGLFRQFKLTKTIKDQKQEIERLKEENKKLEAVQGEYKELSDEENLEEEKVIVSENVTEEDVEEDIEEDREKNNNLS